MPSSRKLEPILIVSDAHRPFHDVKAWQLMMKVAREFKPERIVVIGDFIDCYSVSSHSKDPGRALKLADEVQNAHEGLDDLDSLKAKHKHFIAGNHCDRLERYLRDKAPELFGLIGIPELLKLKDRGWTYTPYKADIKIGKAYFTHDVGVAGRNAVFKAIDTYQHSVVTGHTHRMQYIVEGNAVGEYKLSCQFGWLGDRTQIDYMHKAKVNKDWALGFGVGYVSEAGIAYLTPVPIIPVKGHYTCVVNGTYYES